MTTRGLVLGKFAPLHRGHQLLIERSLAETDQTAVLIYDCPETIEVPLAVRAEWIRDLYPEVEVVEARDGPTEVGERPEIKLRHEQYVLSRPELSGITHFFSSEFYGEHMSLALGALDVRVDEARKVVPISATEIRADPFRHRRFLDPRVYRDLITRVVLVGAPSTGKTTLARALAARFSTVWLDEFGREYWERHHRQRRLSLDQLVEIAEEHLRREDALVLEANRYLFCDTNAWATLAFSHHYHGTARQRLVEIADRARSRADLVILCDDDIPYEDSWDRSGPGNRAEMQAWTIRDLEFRKVPFETVFGTLEERVGKTKRLLAGFSKWTHEKGRVR